MAPSTPALLPAIESTLSVEETVATAKSTLTEKPEGPWVAVFTWRGLAENWAEIVVPFPDPAFRAEAEAGIDDLQSRTQGMDDVMSNIKQYPATMTGLALVHTVRFVPTLVFIQAKATEIALHLGNSFPDTSEYNGSIRERDMLMASRAMTCLSWRWIIVDQCTSYGPNKDKAVASARTVLLTAYTEAGDYIGTRGD